VAQEMLRGRHHTAGAACRLPRNLQRCVCWHPQYCLGPCLQAISFVVGNMLSHFFWPGAGDPWEAAAALRSHEAARHKRCFKQSLPPWRATITQKIKDTRFHTYPAEKHGVDRACTLCLAPQMCRATRSPGQHCGR
jgi:hypothetical protein